MKRIVAAAAVVPAVAMTLQTPPALAVQPSTTPVTQVAAHKPPPTEPNVYARITKRAKDEYKNKKRNKANNKGRYNCNYYSGYWLDSGDGGCKSKTGSLKWRGNEWCADFVYYVWRQSGARPKRPRAGELSKNAYQEYKEKYAPTFAVSFYLARKKIGTYHGKSYYFKNGRMPIQGSAVMFDWDGSGKPGWNIDHVGIVLSANYKKKTITTIEGNSNGQAIRMKTYDMDKKWDRSVIVGYTVPK